MAATGELTVRGVRQGDELPAVVLGSSAEALPPSVLDLAPAAMGLSPRTGSSWGERALGLLDRRGPFQLAYLEALLRAADQRASRLTTPDPLLGEGEG